jgi:16S rRNA (adenine1518-N6/adenine1519-N6)-dimethyltransferase
VEVGPGLGSLTLGLLPKVKKLYCVEIDERLAKQLPITLSNKVSIDNLEVINKDFLEFTKDEIDLEPTALVANLPYNLSVPIILHALLKFPSINTFLLMLQSEVAERICAKENSRVYGVPSVKIQWLTEAKIVSDISRKVFWPEPNVDSSLIQLNRKSNVDLEKQEIFFKVVETAFSQRRKMLKSTLKGLGLSDSELQIVFTKSQVSSQMRAEQLSVADYQRICDQVALILERP